MENEDDGDIDSSWHTGNGLQRLEKETGRIRNRRTNRGYPD